MYAHNLLRNSHFYVDLREINFWDFVDHRDITLLGGDRYRIDRWVMQQDFEDRDARPSVLAPTYDGRVLYCQECGRNFENSAGWFLHNCSSIDDSDDIRWISHTRSVQGDTNVLPQDSTSESTSQDGTSETTSQDSSNTHGESQLPTQLFCFNRRIDWLWEQNNGLLTIDIPFQTQVGESQVPTRLFCFYRHIDWFREQNNGLLTIDIPFRTQLDLGHIWVEPSPPPSSPQYQIPDLVIPESDNESEMSDATTHFSSPSDVEINVVQRISAVSTHFSEEVADVEMTDAYNFDDDYDAGAATPSSSSGDAQQVVVGSAATVAAAATDDNGGDDNGWPKICCSRSFATQPALNAHRAFCNVKVPPIKHLCQFCQQNVYSAIRKLNHEAQCTGNPANENCERFKCEVCGKEFIKQPALASHMKEH